MPDLDTYLKESIEQQIDRSLPFLKDELFRSYTSYPFDCYLDVVCLSAQEPIPVPAGWASPIADWLLEISDMIVNSNFDDAGLLAYIEEAITSLPSLLDQMDHEALAGVFEAAMGQAAVRGAAARFAKLPRKLRALAAEAPLDVAFAPLLDAVKKLDRKLPIASKLTSAEWAKVAVGLRDRAQFSARVESIRFLQEVQKQMTKTLKHETERVKNGDAFVDRSSFIASMRKIANEEGLDTTDSPAQRGTIRDIRSAKRIGLIYDMQRSTAEGYADWKIGNDPDVLDAFPAQRLIRVEERDKKRDWQARWRTAGSKAGWVGASKEAMVALKTSLIWTTLSIFNSPWPPFDWASGMGLEDVDRAETEALGLLSPGQPVQPVPESEQEFNQNLSTRKEGITGEYLTWLREQFPKQLVETDDNIYWGPANA